MRRIIRRQPQTGRKNERPHLLPAMGRKFYEGRSLKSPGKLKQREKHKLFASTGNGGRCCFNKPTGQPNKGRRNPGGKGFLATFLGTERKKATMKSVGDGAPERQTAVSGKQKNSTAESAIRHARDERDSLERTPEVT